MAENTVIRFIDELKDNSEQSIYEDIKNIRIKLKFYRKQTKTPQNKAKIEELYKELDDLEFIPEYLCLIIDDNNDYLRACQGFILNGLSYKRLLGTPGGIKTSTIVFIAEETRDGIKIRNEINHRLDNGRDLSKELVPAKFEAYKALACSASTPVSHPNGVLVVNDCITHFKSDYILLDDSETDEPSMSMIKDGDVELVESDGYGLINPELANQWSYELGETDMLSGFCIRNAFCKGMVFPFDYKEFANQIAGRYIVEDAWGNKVDVRNVDIILTTSMLKLWDSYKSIDEYLSNCKENHYGFSITKACDPVERNSRELNYQFIQSYDLDFEDIVRLVQPTMDDISGVLGGDCYKTILFMKGTRQSENTIESYENDYAKALMINENVINDPHLRDRVLLSMQKRTDNAKLGRIRVDGDFSVISGDPYSLCQSIFGIEVTGLLKAGQVYSAYWLRRNTSEIVCFRAPMSCHNNIRKVTVYHDSRTDYWYRYMNNVLVLNSWDMITQACNGADKDGDTFLATNNAILLERTLNLPTIVCAQRKAQKRVISEDVLIEANVNSFGDPIGAITNRITSMFDIKSKYAADSEQYKILTYRIMCGQLYQQNAIDSAKGIISNPMPEYWYSYKEAKKHDEECFDAVRSVDIVASKKPYFMNYRYPKQKSKYNNFLKVADSKARRKFRSTVNELLASEENKEFRGWYECMIPVENWNSVMNSCCRYIELYLSNTKNVWKDCSSAFDYSIYKSNIEYSESQYGEIEKIYKSYKNLWDSYVAEGKSNHVEFKEINEHKPILIEEVKRKMMASCEDDDMLCDILLDLTYGKGHGNQFVWDICGDTIIKNLLKKSGGLIKYIEASVDGDIEYGGEKYVVREKAI